MIGYGSHGKKSLVGPAPFVPGRPCAREDGGVRWRSWLKLAGVGVGARRALARPWQLSLQGCRVPGRGAYEWGVRSTKKPEPPPWTGCMRFLDWSPSPSRGRCTLCLGWRASLFRPGTPAGRTRSSACAPFTGAFSMDGVCYVFATLPPHLKGGVRTAGRGTLLLYCQH